MVGDELGGYRILARIGSGGMGTVYLAEREGERYALKVLKPELLARPGYFKRFQQEVLAGRRVCHPNVVRTFDGDMHFAGEEPCCYLVMEYVEGRTLADVIHEAGNLPDGLVRRIGLQLAAGLGAVHEQGIVHRDLKPANVMLMPDETVKLMDLGLARVDDGYHVSSSGKFIGSARYAAPEQIESDGRPPDARTDLFALGVVLYELATGAHPFGDEETFRLFERILTEDPPRARLVNPSLSPFLEGVIHRLLSRSREGRFPSAAELHDVLGAGETEGSSERQVSPDGSHRPRPRIPRETAVHGREAELARLGGLFERAAAGSGQAVLVVGAAGIGKTRLIDELVRRLEDEVDLLFLFGSYPPGGAATALEAFAHAFRRRLAEEGMQSGLRRRLTAAPALVRPFGAFLEGEPPAAGTEPLSRDSVQTAFAYLVRTYAAERPVVLFIDDLQFAPREGLALFAALAHAIPEHRVLLVGATRRRLPETWQGELEHLDHVSGLTLERLAPEAAERILAEAVGKEGLGTDVGPLVVARSDGNPFLLFEILRDLRERRTMEARTEGGARGRGPIREIRIPSTVTRLIEARLADLDEEERNLLEVAACGGYEFDPLLVGESLELSRIPLLRRLGRIERTHELIHSTSRGFSFDHHLIHETLYGAIPEVLRQTYHAMLAEMLERRSGGAPGEVRGARAAEICEHHLRAGRPERARAHLGEALDHLTGAYHNERALELIDRSLAAPGLFEPGERVDLLLRAASLHGLTGQHHEMRRCLDAAGELADALADPARRSRVRTHLGSLLFSLGEYAAACAPLGEALALAREASDGTAETEARVQLAAALAELGRLDEARGHYEGCLEIARRSGGRRALAVAIGNLGQIAAERGEVDEARELLEQGLGIFRELGDRMGEAKTGGALGNVLHDLGRYEEALGMHRRHLEISRAIGYRRGQVIALHNLAEALKKLDRLDEAREQIEREGRISAEIGDRLGVVTSLVGLGGIESRVGLRDAARETMGRALRMSREIGSRWMEGCSLLELGKVEEQDGRLEESRALVEEALAVFRDLGEACLMAEALVGLGRIALRLGRAEEAGPALEEARAIGASRGFPYPLVLAFCYLACSGRGSVSAARSLLDEHRRSLDTRQRLEAHFALWKAGGEREDLAASHALLVELGESAVEGPEDATRADVALYREVRDAWRDGAGR